MDLFIVPPAVMVQLREVTREDAARLLAPYRDKLTDQEYDAYLSRAKTSTDPSPALDVRVNVTDPGRRVFMAAAWLVGASFSQLGDLFGVRRQTVQDQVGLVLPKHERDMQARLLTTPIEWELLSVMRQCWEADRQHYGTNPVVMAPLLLADARKKMDD